MSKRLSWVRSATIAAACWFILPVHAQVVPDQTLGLESSTVTPSGTLQIRGGALRGNQLFHSFLKFNVLDGQSVYFDPTTGVQNIFGRVTGGEVSTISGTLGVNGSANLFLLNPNGILFGPNARLDIAGSFLATTATGFKFGNGFEFSATQPEAPPLLTLNVPTGMQWGPQPGAIVNQGHLTVGQNLSLLGGSVTSTGLLSAPAGKLQVTSIAGDISLQGATAQSTDFSAQGHMFLQGTYSVGTGGFTVSAGQTVQIQDSATQPVLLQSQDVLSIQGNQGIQIQALSHPNSGLIAGTDLVLRSSNPIVGDAHFTAGRDFRIEQGDGNLGDLMSPNDPVIRASGNVQINSYTGASLHILAGGSVTIPGAITINGPDATNGLTETFTLSDGVTPVSIAGNTVATLDIRAGTTAFNCAPASCPTIAGTVSGVTTPTGAVTSDITIGNVTIAPTNPAIERFVLLTNQYSPNQNIPAGKIQVGSITTRTAPTDAIPAANAGSVVIDSRGDIQVTGSIDAQNSGRISTFAGIRNGGNITLKAVGNIATRSLLTGVATSAGGTAGAVNIQAGNNVTMIASQGSSRVIDGRGSYGDGSTINIRAGNDLTIANPSGTPGSIVTFAAQANGGTLTLNAGRDLIIGTVSTFSGSAVPDLNRFDGGSVFATAGGILSVGSLNLATGISGSGFIGLGRNGGNAVLTSGGDMTVQAINASGGPTGSGGDIRLTSGGAFSTQNLIQTDTQGSTQLGNITLNAQSLSLANGGQFSTGTSNAANGGNIKVNVTGAATISGVGGRQSGFVNQQVSPTGTGNAGTIEVTAGSLAITGGGLISTNTYGKGTAGSVHINVAGEVKLDGTAQLSGAKVSSSIVSRVEAGGTGQSGNVDLTAGSLTLTNGGQISTSTRGLANGGNIKLKVNNALQVNGFGSLITSQVGSTAQGNAGNIEATAGSLTVSNGGQISTTTFNKGNAGTIRLNIAGAATIDGMGGASNSGIISQVDQSGQGNAGGVELNAASLTIRNGGQISAATFGKGDSGNVKLNISGTALLDGASSDGTFRSTITSQVNPTAIGNGGNVELNAGALTVLGGAQISASTFGQGNAGVVKLNIAGNTRIEGTSLNGTASGIGSQVNPGARGNAGGIDLTTGSLTLAQGAFISANTMGIGAAGKVQITVADSALITGTDRNGNPTYITSMVDEQAIGNAGGISLIAKSLTLSNSAVIGASSLGQGESGNIYIQADQFRVNQNGRVLTGTSGAGNAGTIVIRVLELLEVDGSGSSLTAITTPDSTGNGGNIDIDPDRVVVSNGARIAVDSKGSGNAGNLLLIANQLLLDNGTLSATTASGEGGNINLQIRDLLLMRWGSQITTKASGSGNGGNIRINAGLIAAVPTENSNIIADAIQGRGGNIQITTQGIFGFYFGKPSSQLSHISATSQFGVNGVVSVARPSVDPSQGIMALPTAPIDPSRLIAQGCSRGATQAGRFFVTGRGGLPINPQETLSGQSIWRDARTPYNSPAQATGPLSPAQAWQFDPAGNVRLLAERPMTCNIQ